MQGFTKANQALNYYFWLSELEPTIRETPKNKELGPPAGCTSFEFTNVQFSYPLAPNIRVLKGVSLKASIFFTITNFREPVLT